MKKLLIFLTLIFLSLLIISCSGGGSSSSSGETTTSPSSSSSSSSASSWSCPTSSAYTVENSTVDDATSITDNSSITESSSVDNSIVRVCSSISSSDIDNSTIDNSTITGSTVSNSTLDTATINATSTIDNASISNSTITNSNIDNNSTITNSTITNSNIDNSTIDNMTISNNSVVNDQTLQNDTVSGFNSSTLPTVSAVYIEKSNSLESADTLSNGDPDTNIYIYFSEAMDTTSITTNTSGTSCSGTFQLSTDSFSNCVQMSSSPSVSNTNKIFTFDPSSNLSDGTVYKIRVTTGVKDGSGNNMSSQYQTGTGFTISK